MDAINTILTRISTRKFNGTPISDDALHTILKAGMAGSTAVNARPWSFIVVQDKDMPCKMADGNGRAAEQPRRQHSAVKFSYKEQRDFETIEDTVMQLEEKVEALAAEIEANAADYVKVAALMAEQEDTQHKLDEATERWLFLQEKWEQIQAQKNQ